MKTLSKIAYTVVLAGGWILGGASSAVSQSVGNAQAIANPFESQFFTNRYLGNPSMAGMDSTLNLNVAYRKQFSNIPGAPVTQVLTADYNPGRRVGLGFMAYNDKAGLIKRTRFALTYAYHLPVGRWGQQLHFGISAAFAHASLDAKGIVGDETDPAITAFNGRKNNFEVDYGMAYTNGPMTLQASLMNLVGYFKNANQWNADFTTFYLAAAYKFSFDGAVNSLEPQASLRGVKQYNSIVDVGARAVMFHHILSVFGLFHTTGSFSTGVGINYKNRFFIQGAYLSKTSGLEDYTDGNYEIALKIALFGKRYIAAAGE